MKLKDLKRKRSNRAASEVLEDASRRYQESAEADRVSIGELMEVLHERGFGILLIICVIPACIPLPLPFTGVVGFPLMWLSLQMIWGADHPWLPSWINRRTFKRNVLAMMVSKASPMMRKIEKLLRPRMAFASSESGEKVMGLLCFIFAFCILIPLPWTNLIPGYGILVMSLGLISRDGVIMLLGAFVGLIGTLISIAVVTLGTAAITAVMG